MNQQPEVPAVDSERFRPNRITHLLKTGQFDEMVAAPGRAEVTPQPRRPLCRKFILRRFGKMGEQPAFQFRRLEFSGREAGAKEGDAAADVPARQFGRV